MGFGSELFAQSTCKHARPQRPAATVACSARRPTASVTLVKVSSDDVQLMAADACVYLQRLVKTRWMISGAARGIVRNHNELVSCTIERWDGVKAEDGVAGGSDGEGLRGK
jgi:hypothetical protein